MNEKLLLTFILLNAANVIIQTIKSLVTIKCGKFSAAVVNALAYGLYAIVVVYMVCELPLFWKAGIIAACNFIGVFIVKWFEEKMRKDKLWKVEATIPYRKGAELLYKIEEEYPDLAYNYVDINKYYLFNFYCPTQKESTQVHELVKHFDAKYFATEGKSL